MGRLGEGRVGAPAPISARRGRSTSTGTATIGTLRINPMDTQFEGLTGLLGLVHQVNAE